MFLNVVMLFLWSIFKAEKKRIFFFIKKKKTKTKTELFESVISLTFIRYFTA